MIYIGYSAELNIVRHCNFSCAECNHNSPNAAPKFMNYSQAGIDLEYISRIAKFERLVIQGGEPLLHKRIIDFMYLVKEFDIANHYAILTNGSLLLSKDNEFFEVVKKLEFQIRVSLYPKLSISYEKLKRLLEGFNINFYIEPFEEFTKMQVVHKDKGERIWKECLWKHCYTIHEGYLYHCPISAFFQPLGYEGYLIKDLTTAKLQEILTRQTPLRMCETCGGGLGEKIKWQETQ